MRLALIASLGLVLLSSTPAYAGPDKPTTRPATTPTRPATKPTAKPASNPASPVRTTVSLTPAKVYAGILQKRKELRLDAELTDLQRQNASAAFDKWLKSYCVHQKVEWKGTLISAELSPMNDSWARLQANMTRSIKLGYVRKDNIEKTLAEVTRRLEYPFWVRAQLPTVNATLSGFVAKTREKVLDSISPNDHIIFSGEIDHIIMGSETFPDNPRIIIGFTECEVTKDAEAKE